MQVWCCWQVKLCWSTPERIRGEVLTTMRYTNRRFPLPLPGVTTCLEKLEMLGHLTAVMEMSRNWQKVEELSWKLFIFNWTFGATPMFNSTVCVTCVTATWGGVLQKFRELSGNFAVPGEWPPCIFYSFIMSSCSYLDRCTDSTMKLINNTLYCLFAE